MVKSVVASDFFEALSKMNFGCKYNADLDLVWNIQFLENAIKLFSFDKILKLCIILTLIEIII